MPLEILLVLVIGGIAGIALALHLLGYSATKRLNAGAARTEWLRHFPNDTFREGRTTLINARADRALLRSDQGAGLIWVMGADTSARRLTAPDWMENRRGLVFRFDDPGAPRISVALGEEERPGWLAFLRNFHGH